ncbi:GNAT family N-acetyltransferase [Pseudoalteromonas ulvae]|uniref:GNAT family N-acetyltransferase n=1 Tax=Pseudoalteromonas ulvae TaxID=107327 RepID=A0A244CL52_PSEDV|nr:GNAT family N-acetyltransferase [Pseudoalteromonas ulvae]OUL56340.1 GNAT family N-acetyltransferase [Pseudoalteromonas ulvae]
MLYLRKPVVEDEAEIKSLYERSGSLHRPWSYPPKDYHSYLSDYGRYFLCLEETGDIVGTFNVSGVVRGYFQSAYLGYEVFSPYHGKGFMRIGLALFIKEAFGQLNLHRLEANIQPENEVSIKLVLGAGFVKEGFSRNYLNIGGQGWRDHERWALVNEHWHEENS